LHRAAPRGRQRVTAVGRWWRRHRATSARDRGRPRDGGTAAPTIDVVRRPFDADGPGVRITPGGRLADGLIIDASIVARLLGLRLLTLDARIRLAPARFTAAGPPAPPTTPAPDRTGTALGDLGPLNLPWPPAVPARVPPGGLGDASDLLADAGRRLDRVRQDLTASPLSIHDQAVR
jgi:hypothetical protein